MEVWLCVKVECDICALWLLWIFLWYRCLPCYWSYMDFERERYFCSNLVMHAQIFICSNIFNSIALDDEIRLTICDLFLLLSLIDLFTFWKGRITFLSVMNFCPTNFVYIFSRFAHVYSEHNLYTLEWLTFHSYNYDSFIESK